MKTTLEAIIDGGFILDPESHYFKFNFGEGYELSLEPLVTPGQFYVALYKNEDLLIEKIPVKIGKE